MHEDFPDVPPAVLLLITAFAESKDWGGLRKRIKLSLKDLREQSIAYEIYCLENSKNKYRSNKFDIHLHGGLDLFDGSGACSDLPCRVKAADRICRSMGLIADRVWITDLITEKFTNFGRITNEKLDRIVADTLVLGRLAPMILGGIIRFRSPWNPVCKHCLAEFEDKVQELAAEIRKEFKKETTYKKTSTSDYIFDSGNFFEPSVIYRNILPEINLPKHKDIAEGIIYRQIHSALWVSRETSLQGGSIFSNSRVGLAGLLKQSGGKSDSKHLMLLDNDRSIVFPWVSALNPSQILELREEASRALPLFREMMTRTLEVQDNLEIDSCKTRDFINDLREQAEVVRAELLNMSKNSARFWKSSYGLLGLCLSAYGVANDQVLPGVGGLLPLIQLLINHKSGHEKNMDQLTYRPGYVLVKAQDILAHATH